MFNEQVIVIMVQGFGSNEDGLFASADHDYHTSVSKRTKLNFPQSNHQVFVFF